MSIWSSDNLEFTFRNNTIRGEVALKVREPKESNKSSDFQQKPTLVWNQLVSLVAPKLRGCLSFWNPLFWDWLYYICLTVCMSIKIWFQNIRDFSKAFEKIYMRSIWIFATVRISEIHTCRQFNLFFNLKVLAVVNFVTCLTFLEF